MKSKSSLGKKIGLVVGVAIYILAGLILTICIVGITNIAKDSYTLEAESAMNSFTHEMDTYKTDAQNFSNSIATDEILIANINTTNNEKINAIVQDELTKLPNHFAVLTDSNGDVFLNTSTYNKTDFKKINTIVSALSGQKMSDSLQLEDGDYVYISTSPIKNNGVIVGTSTVGFSYNSGAIIDDIANSGLGKYSIFAGETRINTTILNDNKEREVGTKADATVFSRVQGKNQIVKEKITLFDKPYYAIYKPLLKTDNSIFGMMAVAENGIINYLPPRIIIIISPLTVFSSLLKNLI